MYRSSIAPVLSNVVVASILNAFGTRPAGAVLDDMRVDLITAGPSVITPDNVVADFTKATFSGYASVTLTTASLPNIEVPANNGLALAGNALFVADAFILAPGEIITGYIVTDQATGLILYAAELFDDPVPISVFGNFCNLTVLYPVLTKPIIA